MKENKERGKKRAWGRKKREGENKERGGGKRGCNRSASFNPLLLLRHLSVKKENSDFFFLFLFFFLSFDTKRLLTNVL